MKKLVAASFCLLVCVMAAFAQAGDNQQVNRDPDKARLVTSDIENFWRAFDLATKESQREKRIAIFQTQYLDKGSEGLRDFLRLRVKSAKNLAEAVEKLPKFYASIRPSTLRVREMEKQIRKSFRNFKKLYPDAVFPDVYFVIGMASTGGTVSQSGLLVGMELYGLRPDTPRDEFPGFFKSLFPSTEKDEKQYQLTVNRLLDTALKRVEDLPPVVAHEAIHFNQHYQGKVTTLLGQSTHEGAADFLGEMISGRLMTPSRNLYGDRHEAELWREFQSEMLGEKMSNWLYNGITSKDRPSDLGYYMGYKICQSYYRNAKDKRQAIRDILNIQDFRAFLEKSRYQGGVRPAKS